MNYSVTQGSNIAALVAVLALLSTKLQWGMSADDITVIVAGVIAVVAIVVSFINRYKKGDINIAGFKSPVVEL